MGDLPFGAQLILAFVSFSVTLPFIYMSMRWKIGKIISIVLAVIAFLNAPILRWPQKVVTNPSSVIPLSLVFVFLLAMVWLKSFEKLRKAFCDDFFGRLIRKNNERILLSSWIISSWFMTISGLAFMVIMIPAFCLVGLSKGLAGS